MEATEEIRNIIKLSPVKSCELDPLRPRPVHPIGELGNRLGRQSLGGAKKNVGYYN